MQPHRRPLPFGCRQRFVPLSPEHSGIELRPEGCDRSARRRVASRERLSAEDVYLTRRRPTRGVDALQRRDESGEIDRELNRVGDPIRRCGLSGEPAIHGPRERIAAGRLSLRQRNGSGQGQLGAEPREPVPLHLECPARPGRARQPNDLVVTEAVDGIVGPPRRDLLNRGAGPLRKLLHEPAHDGNVDVDLVLVHPRRHGVSAA